MHVHNADVIGSSGQSVALSFKSLCQIMQACKEGDLDSQRAIGKLAPKMANALKHNMKWEEPMLTESTISDSIRLVTDKADLANLKFDSVGIFQHLIERELGPKFDDQQP